MKFQLHLVAVWWLFQSELIRIKRMVVTTVGVEIIRCSEISHENVKTILTLMHNHCLMKLANLDWSSRRRPLGMARCRQHFNWAPKVNRRHSLIKCLVKIEQLSHLRRESLELKLSFNFNFLKPQQNDVFDSNIIRGAWTTLK